MAKCKICGGNCVARGGGRYECDCCGNVSYIEEQPAPKKKEAPSEDIGVDVFEKNINSVCEIVSGMGCGSGYLVDTEGTVITNAHVVAKESGEPFSRCSVKIAGETVGADVVAVGTDDSSKHCTVLDLALLKLDRVPLNAKPVKFADFDNVRTGEKVYAVGNSLGRGTCIVGGIVSDKHRESGLLMADCATNSGNSGGPLFNAEGDVIATVVAGSRHPTENYVVDGMRLTIPTPYVVKFIQDVTNIVSVVKATH